MSRMTRESILHTTYSILCDEHDFLVIHMSRMTRGIIIQARAKLDLKIDRSQHVAQAKLDLRITLVNSGK